MVLAESYTQYGNALRIFLDMESKDYENGCISFAHLRTYLDHTRVNIKDPANTNTIFMAFMLLYFGGVFLGARRYQCYEYCQIGHHILIDNRNMKGALKREVFIAGNISRKRVLLQSPFGGYEWYLGDRCWAQLENRAVPYDPPEKLYYFSSLDVVRSLRAAGLGALTAGVTFPHVEFPTGDFSTQEIQIPPPQLGDYPRWIMEFRTLNLEARHLHDESRITHLMTDLRRAEGHLSQLNDYLDGEGIVVDWEDNKGKMRTSQAGSSRGRRSWGRTSKGGAAPPRRSRRMRGSFE
ncbi:hypothetical protein GIB67_036369 [Kingdonia uniflora]|uniref:Uncharacterized protein n=1 Tax=Kingdonia uniflora TaxID=39325 RepID=A0A7J7L438_9MAGN|nr:hypothetical protein GIB67_036369 [Kingdonia uniflora]